MKDGKIKSGAHAKSSEDRAALAKMVTKLFDLWNLHVEEQMALLGLSENSRRSLAQYRKGNPLADRRDLLDRVANLLAIHRSLRILFPRNGELIYKWLKIPNRTFGGSSPVEFIRKKGFSGLVAVKRYLDFERER